MSGAVVGTEGRETWRDDGGPGRKRGFGALVTTVTPRTRRGPRWLVILGSNFDLSRRVISTYRGGKKWVISQRNFDLFFSNFGPREQTEQDLNVVAARLTMDENHDASIRARITFGGFGGAGLAFA